ncbi:MAG: glycosyltransferase [Anaerolineales bacterium]|nr:glycosyltransferase [Anaerolineales bacterium]MCB9172275.1 glycosyltransferase [Ardenticatenales bacterium]
MRPVTVVLTILNEAESLILLLESLAQQSRLPDEIVVVDGGSTDGTIALLQGFSTVIPLRLIVEEGANISRGRNLAIEAARHDLIVTTDAGVRLAPEWLARLTSPFEQPDPPDFVSGFFLPDPQGLWEHALAMTTLPAVEEMGRGRFLPSARSAAFTRQAWARVGGYPEWMRWSEDVLFDLALMNSGAKIVYEPEAVVWFRPRSTWRGFLKQYRNYAYGDGQGLLWPKRHLSRYLTYFMALPLGLALLKRRPALGLALFAASALAMFGTPLKRHWRRGAYRWRALPLIPLIRISGDLAKMWGFPQALAYGWRHRRQTRAYLEGAERQDP